MSKSARLLPLLFALLPIQFNKFFFFDNSLVLGIPIDYLAYALYLSDLFIAAYILLNLTGGRQYLENVYKKRKVFVLGLLTFTFYLFLNALFISNEQNLAIYSTAKFLEFGLLALFASLDLEDSKVITRVKALILASLAWQALLAVFQFLFQKSAGLWFLGERTFDASTPTIANALVFDRLMLRPYGTFPHPNVLGAFFLVFLIIFLSPLPNLKNSPLKKAIIIASALALVLTNSKTAILLAIVFMIFSVFKFKKAIFALASTALIASLYFKTVAGASVASIAERLVLFDASFTIAQKSPIFGIGSRGFIEELAKLNLYSIGEVRLLQPVHNVFLLILSENGVIGLLLFTFLLLIISSAAKGTTKLILFFAMILYLSVDHFLWTLHQGQYLFALATAYILASPKKTAS